MLTLTILFTEDQDYVVPSSFARSALLDVTTNRDCRVVEILDDSLQESTESFIFRLTLSSGQFDVNGDFQVSVPQTEVFILDNDALGI